MLSLWHLLRTHLRTNLEPVLAVSHRGNLETAANAAAAQRNNLSPAAAEPAVVTAAASHSGKSNLQPVVAAFQQKRSYLEITAAVGHPR